ncbi:coiled-coil domain-containing protein 22 homolog [Oratosquilla oratoria]|uniref:coiled-coil domain-containing protein 22 homolog n=1 Tax=Oratosquilla oratoria TaxID=337810 RepID=UPI003F76C35F
MKEVDGIIIHTLRQLGCDLEEDVNHLGGLGVEEVVSGVIRCVRIISPASSLPAALPHNMAQRFRVASAVAQAVKDLGYSSDLGYQSLLYPTESDLRKIFMFLIEKLPKESAKISHEPLSPSAILHQQARRSIGLALSRPWIPVFCRRVSKEKAAVKVGPSLNLTTTLHCRSFSSAPAALMTYPETYGEELDDFFKNDVVRVTRRINKKQQLASSLLEQHRRELQHAQLQDKTIPKESVVNPSDLKIINTADKVEVKDVPEQPQSQFGLNLAQKLLYTQEEEKEAISENIANVTTDDLKEEQQKKREERIKSLRTDISQTAEELQEVTDCLKELQSSLEEIEQQITKEQAAVEAQQLDYDVKHRTCALLPQAGENIAKLQAVLQRSEERMQKLKRQWEDHRQPLQQQLDELQQRYSGRIEEHERMQKDVVNMRSKMRLLAEEGRNKDALIASLKQKHASMNRGINRSAYTKGIFEIIGNIKKQKDEIQKVLQDTRSLQKEINTLTGKLDRTFAEVEESAFKAASTTEGARGVYKAVASIHELYGQLVDVVRETGAVQRDIRDLEEQLIIEKKKKNEDNLKSVSQDLANMKTENQKLIQELEKKS